jgi:hypothetical protein
MIRGATPPGPGSFLTIMVTIQAPTAAASAQNRRTPPRYNRVVENNGRDGLSLMNGNIGG